MPRRGDGQYYFLNEATGETRWELPQALVADPERQAELAREAMGMGMGTPGGGLDGGDSMITPGFGMDSTVFNLDGTAMEASQATVNFGETSFMSEGGWSPEKQQQQQQPEEEEEEEEDEETRLARLELEEEPMSITSMLAHKVVKKALEKGGRALKALEREWHAKMKKKRAHLAKVKAQGTVNAAGADFVPPGHLQYESYMRKKEEAAAAEGPEEAMARPVNQVDLKGNVLKQYETAHQVCEEIACHPLALLAVLEGKSSKVNGQKFASRPTAAAVAWATWT